MTERDQRFGFFGVLREVGWAFLGVRDRGNYERATRSKPVQIILAGVLLTAILVGLLIGVVSLALSEHSSSRTSTQAVPGKVLPSKVMVDQ